ncbi:MAG TPA: GNAT family N-acetyltransferase [Terriglobia bacterium]|nr:GNAT family N-acetyltransferase [Terriglobia bacterium]
MAFRESELRVELLNPSASASVGSWLGLYERCFNPDERVSSAVIRRVLRSPRQRLNPIHLFAAYHRRELIGGVLTVLLQSFDVVFGSYIFVAAPWRGQGIGALILRRVLRQEKQAPEKPWRMYAEITQNSGPAWRHTLSKAGFRFFRTPWPIPSYQDPHKVMKGTLCYYPFHALPPERFSQPAMLAYVYSLFYGAENMHRHLLPRLKSFISIEA